MHVSDAVREDRRIEPAHAVCAGADAFGSRPADRARNALSMMNFRAVGLHGDIDEMNDSERVDGDRGIAARDDEPAARHAFGRRPPARGVCGIADGRRVDVPVVALRR